jgi:hypothetical protein
LSAHLASAFLTPWCEIADPRSCIAVAIVRRLFARLLHPAHCEQRLALTFERLKRSVCGNLPAEWPTG